MTTSTQLSKDLYNLYSTSFSSVARDENHIRQMVSDSLNKDRSRAHLELVQRLTKAKLKNKKMLEIGSGIGLTLLVAREEYNVDAFGIEPEEDNYKGTFTFAQKILSKLEQKNIIVNAMGENIPFEDESFDFVISSNVLEHTTNPKKVISEAIRVLKPGGFCQIIVPNYGSWWEGHYGIIWFPFMPLKIAKLYLKLLKKDPSFLDTLQFVNYFSLKNALKSHNEKIQLMSWGQEIWAERLETLNFAEYSALGRLRKIILFLKNIGLIPILKWIGKFLHWETPFILTFRKI